MVFIGIILALFSGIIIGLAIRDYNTVTLTDTYTPNSIRSDVMQAQDDVMKLKNEIANSGAVKRKYLPDDKVKLTLKVVK